MATYRKVNSIEGLNKSLRYLPTALGDELRDVSETLSKDLAQEASTEARSLGKVAGLVADTIRPRRERVPVIRMGGARRLPASGNGWGPRSRRGPHQTVGDIMWGAEFGSRRFRQFPAVAKGGRFLFSTIERQNDHIMRTYTAALDGVLRRVPERTTVKVR